MKTKTKTPQAIYQHEKKRSEKERSAAHDALLKDAKDAPYVRDEILRTVARARSEAVPAAQLADAKSAARYGFIRTLDNTNAIASILAQFVHYRRSYATLNNAYRLYEQLTPASMRAAAARYFTDPNLVVVTLSNGPLPEAVATQPKLATLSSATSAAVITGCAGAASSGGDTVSAPSRFMNTRFLRTST